MRHDIERNVVARHQITRSQQAQRTPRIVIDVRPIGDRQQHGRGPIHRQQQVCPRSCAVRLVRRRRSPSFPEDPIQAPARRKRIWPPASRHGPNGSPGDVSISSAPCVTTMAARKVCTSNPNVSKLRTGRGSKRPVRLQRQLILARGARIGPHVHDKAAQRHRARLRRIIEHQSVRLDPRHRETPALRAQAPISASAPTSSPPCRGEIAIGASARKITRRDHHLHVQIGAIGLRTPAAARGSR